MKSFGILGGLFAVLLAGSALAQTEPAPNYLNPLSKLAPAQGVVLIDPITKNPYTATGGGGGGGGATTIANGSDVTQGNTADAACATDNGTCTSVSLLKRNNQRLTSTITVLGSPFQAGGSIGNTSFGISGTLPAFASTPTVNLGTIGSVATAANQTTANTSLGNIDTDLGAAADAACASGAGTCSLNAVLKGILTAAQDTTAVAVSDGSGSLTIDGSLTNISGTISLPTGAATSANQASVIGTKAAGTAATNSELIGGVYNTSLPTLTNGQQAAAQFDSSARLIVNCATGCSGSSSGATANASDLTFSEGQTLIPPSVDLNGYARSLVKGTVTAVGAIAPTTAVGTVPGTPVMCRAESTSVTYTDDQLNMLTCATTGHLRVAVGDSNGSAVTSNNVVAGVTEGSRALLTGSFTMLHTSGTSFSPAYFYPQQFGTNVGTMAVGETPSSSLRIAANTAGTVVKNAAGALKRVCVGVAGVSANLLTLYDNASAASGTVLFDLDTTAKGCYELNVKAANGIYAVLAAGTAGTLTITYD